MKKFSFSHSNAYGNKIDLAVEIGRGQPRVMIYTNFVVQTLILHTKFQGNWPSGSEEIYERFWAFLSMVAILVM